MSYVLVALVALAGTLGGQWLIGVQASHARKEEWARQDTVAAAATEAAEKVAAKTEEVAAAAEEVKRLLADSTATTDAKLDQIHTLVNSNLTASMQETLEATVRDLASLREVARLNETAGHEPSAQVLTVIKEAEARVEALRVEVADRLEQTKAATAAVEKAEP
jgi:hypothetical protein